ncbi:MAG: WG repeat-containing protein [Deltaproteobacteria bacterium]|nr:WG repeat-containing protein [Deltaproteobacteria bacterium]
MRIPPKFAAASRFNEGAAVVAMEGRRGLIDDHGAWLIEPFLVDATELHSGRLAVVVRGRGWVYVDRAGHVTHAPTDRQRWAHAGPFLDGRARVVVDAPIGIQRPVGYLDLDGGWAIAPALTDGDDFADGLAAAKDGLGRWGFIDRRGAWVIAPRWAAARSFSDGLAPVADDDGAIRYLDPRGREVCRSPVAVPSIASADLPRFAEDRCPVPGPGGAIGYMDRHGAIAIPPHPRHVGGFAGGRARIHDADGRTGYIDATGAVVIPPRFGIAEDFLGGVARVVVDPRRPGKVGWIDRDGGWVWHPERTRRRRGRTTGRNAPGART